MLFITIIYLISSDLFAVIITGSWVILPFHRCLTIAAEIGSIKLLPYWLFYRTFRIFFLLFMIIFFSTYIRELLQVAWIFQDGLIQIFLRGTGTLDSRSFFILASVLIAGENVGLAGTLLHLLIIFSWLRTGRKIVCILPIPCG